MRLRFRFETVSTYFNPEPSRPFALVISTSVEVFADAGLSDPRAEDVAMYRWSHCA
jgi:hypothetical protein